MPAGPATPTGPCFPVSPWKLITELTQLQFTYQLNNIDAYETSIKGVTKIHSTPKSTELKP